MKAAGFDLMAMIAGLGARYAPQREIRAMRSAGTHVGRGPGWGRAQVKRMAAKRRNVQRNRAAHRGKRGRS